MSEQEPSKPTPAAPDKSGQPPPPLTKAAKPKVGTKAAKYIVDKVHVWPHLTRMEMLAAIAATLLLTVWSITIDAPLEEPSNPARTPNGTR